MTREEFTYKICSICKINHQQKGVGIGTCKACSKSMKEDLEVLFTAGEMTLIENGYTLLDVYSNSNKASGVAGRRMLAYSLHRLSGATSEAISMLFRIRGKEISAANVRSLYITGQDHYQFNKHLSKSMDDFTLQLLKNYKLSDNIFKKWGLNNINTICNILIEEFKDASPELCMEVSRKILNRVINDKILIYDEEEQN